MSWLRRILLACLLAGLARGAAAQTFPVYKGHGTFTANAGAVAIPYPTGAAAPMEDDVCLLVVESEAQTISLSTPAGFAEVTNSPQTAGTAATNPGTTLAVYWKRTVGGDTNPTVADSGDHQTGIIHCFRGVKKTGNPWNITAGGNDSAANDTSGVIPGATTTVVNTLVVLITSTSNNATATTNCGAVTNADLASLTEQNDNSNTINLGGGSCLITGTKATTGAYADSTLTMGATTFKGAMSIALEGITDGANNIDTDVWQVFDNATLNTTNLAAEDHYGGGGTWSITDASSKLSNTTNASHPMVGTVDGATDSGTRGLEYNTSGGATAFVQLTFPNNVKTLSMGWWLNFSCGLQGTFNEYDWMAIETDLATDDPFVKLCDQCNGTGTGTTLHIFRATASEYSAGVSITCANWYWVTLIWAPGSATGYKMRVYDVNNNLVGSEQVLTTASNNDNLIDFQLGPIVGGPSYVGSVYTDILIVDWSDVTYPLGPPTAPAAGGGPCLRSLTGYGCETSHPGFRKR